MYAAESGGSVCVGGGGVLLGYGRILMCTVIVSDCAYYNTKSI